MDQKFVITVGRQFGSGGRVIGRRLAEMLGITYYDKELMKEAARESGLCSEFFDRADERAPTTFMHALSMGFGYDGILSNENIFRFQSETIRRVAERESCVIVGRCADYILRDHRSVSACSCTLRRRCAWPRSCSGTGCRSARPPN